MPGKYKLSPRAVERLFLYARFLRAKQKNGANNVFSHELSLAIGVSPEQVRRDLMSLNVRGTPQHGYLISSFLEDINLRLSAGLQAKAVIVGVGNLGKALISHFAAVNTNLKLIAAFDNDNAKVGSTFAGCNVYHISGMGDILRKEKPLLGIIATPTNCAQQLAGSLASFGVHGLLNFAPIAIKAPHGVFVEQVDIMMALEKTAFFARAELAELN